MATGSFGGQLESAISGRLTGDPYEKRRQAAMGSYQDQASKSRKDLSERLNRLGVLRGGGATASQFGEFESGVLRGQQSIDAQFEAQRDAGVGQAIQQGIGLYGTNQQYGLAGRQQNEADRMGQFSRDLGTREFLSQDALRRDQQRESERSALAQEGMQRGALTGIYDGNRTLDQQRQDLSYRTGLAQTFGRDIAGNEGATEAARAQGIQERYQQAGVTGTFDGKDTLQKSLSEAELTGRYGAEDTLASQSIALQKGQALGKIGDQDTLAREAQREDRDLQAILGQAQINQQTAERGTRVSEAALDREARLGETQSDRELRAIQSQQQFNLATADRASREGMQQAQFGEDARGREFQQTESTRDREFQMQMRASELEAQGVQAAEARKLAREELYGGVTTDYERAMGAKTLASSGQAADIAAENRRLAEMETAGVSQRGLAERELTQRSAMAEQQRALDREQLYGRAMTREEQMSGLGYAGGTLGAQELTQRESEAALDRQSQADLLSQSGRQDISRDTGMNKFNIEMEGARQGFESGERGLDRSLTRDESAEAREMQGYLANVDRVQQEQDRALRGELGRGQLGLGQGQLEESRVAGAAGRRLAEAEVYGRGQGGQTLAAREAAASRGLQGEDLALRRDLGERGLMQDARRIGLSEAELYGQGQGGKTLAAREAAAGRRLEGRRLTEIERAGADASTQAGRRTDLAQAELYGESQAYGKTLGAREADAGREFESGERALDRGVTTQEGQANRRVAREELYGSANYGQDATSLALQDLDLRQELGRGELEERVAAGQAGRFQEGRRTDLAQAELYGSGRGGDTLQSRLAQEETGRIGAATALEAERYDTQRGDYASALEREASDRAWQGQMDVFGARRAAEAVGGRFSETERDVLASKLDPNYQPARTIEDWNINNPLPASRDFTSQRNDAGQAVLNEDQMAEFEEALRNYRQSKRERERILANTRGRITAGMMD
jgi:hypothetical protein